MHYFSRFTYLFFILLFTTSVQAQEKIHQDPDVWPEWQAEYVFKSTSFLYFRNQYRFSTNPGFKGVGEQFPMDQLRRFQIRAGYEHIFNRNWSVGGSEMFGIEPNRNLLFTDVYVRHLNTLFGLQMAKRIMVDYLYYSNSPTKIGRFRPRLDIDKGFKRGNVTIRPRVGYELFINTDFKEDTHTSERHVDRTRFRFEVSLQLSPHINLTPYFIKQTDYSVTPDGIDEQTHLPVKGNKRNSILPIWGIEVRYIFFQGNAPFSRVPVPAAQQD